MQLRRTALVLALPLAVAVSVSACGSGSKKASNNPGGGASGGAKHKGKIAVLLPDTQSSARWEGSDRPYFMKAFQAAGLSSSDYIIENAQGSATTQQTQAEQAITNGATVLMLVNLDNASGAAIEKAAVGKGLKVIDYDRLTLNGAASYYVSFNNVTVGQLQGQGLVNCLTKQGQAKPNIFELDGSPDDNNATLFAQGYNSVLNPLYQSGKAVKVGEQAVPGWDNQKALTIFEQVYTAHPNITAVDAANDGLGNAVISVLKDRHVPPNKVPVTGQDATLQGLQNILSGYQCMTVYKPVQNEAAAAAQLALELQAGKSPTGINAQSNAKSHMVPSILLTPIAVTTANMASTVIKDGFQKASEVCAGAFASKCAAAGIK